MSADILTQRAKRRRWLKIAPAFRTPLAITGITIAALWVLIAIFAPILAPFDPLAQDFDRLMPPGGEHLFGTDAVGRDVLSRVISGARISMPLALALVVASMVVGGTLGAIAGYFGRAVDEIIMRIADLVFAFPTIILAMVITAALGPSLTNAVIAMLIVSWPAYARVTRSLVISARRQEYVVAGRLLGNSPFTTLRRDILPNVLSPVFVLAMLDVGTAILLLAGLSFLGLGATPPLPDWGAMVSDGVQQFSSWWIAAFPGLAIFTVVMAFNFIGDSLRDSLDPRAQDAVQGRAM
ncbi:ABC transporter permease [Mycetocola lacteus]|uniref:ABC transporter permease n=1 Tax=Mycetocola lacteus TaxID=76637 RepID=A0A3L7AKM6_9MICO|nr:MULTISPECIES: ABC transporter permease [Mycetocola]MCS4275476.1 peptide/nickel transport system permease protein [Mycetocola sp. BIGb0189]RLP80827.1 ABC transporter permease [Mycetocola lacteus]RLP84612.1 ABC transporter permease [Mycetocola lacteus]